MGSLLLALATHPARALLASRDARRVCQDPCRSLYATQAPGVPEAASERAAAASRHQRTLEACTPLRKRAIVVQGQEAPTVLAASPSQGNSPSLDAESASDT